jgi:hypothetical protein
LLKFAKIGQPTIFLDGEWFTGIQEFNRRQVEQIVGLVQGHEDVWKTLTQMNGGIALTPVQLRGLVSDAVVGHHEKGYATLAQELGLNAVAIQPLCEMVRTAVGGIFPAFPTNPHDFDDND